MNNIHKIYVNSFVFRNGKEAFDWESLVNPSSIDGRGFFKYDEIDPELKANIQRITLKEDNGSCDYITFKMPELSVDKIKCSYSGKPGCMCGCLGKYAYTKAGNKFAPSYYSEVDKQEITRESTVKRAYNQMVKLAKEFGVEVINGSSRVVGKGDIFSIDFRTNEWTAPRRKTIYLLEA